MTEDELNIPKEHLLFIVSVLKDFHHHLAIEIKDNSDSSYESCKHISKVYDTMVFLIDKLGINKLETTKKGLRND